MTGTNRTGANIYYSECWGFMEAPATAPEAVGVGQLSEETGFLTALSNVAGRDGIESKVARNQNVVKFILC